MHTMPDRTPTPCPECGGERIETKLNSYPPTIIVPRKTFFFTTKQSPMRGLTCIRCGNTTFYAVNPERLVQGR